MNQRIEHPQLVVNPFVIYIGMAVVAVVLQLLVPLPFVSRQTARIAGVVIMVINLVIGLPAVRGMLKAKTSPNPNHVYWLDPFICRIDDIFPPSMGNIILAGCDLVNHDLGHSP
jgi:hypothetical protein